MGSWSPDSRKFAYVVVGKGKNKLAIVDIRRPKRPVIIEIPGIPALNNPAWSPNGEKVLFTGQSNGRTNIFTYNLSNGGAEGYNR